MRRSTIIAALCALVLGAVLTAWFLTRSTAPGGGVGSATSTPLPHLAYENPPVPIAPPLAPPLAPGPGEKVYRSEFYRFQFRYPDTLSLMTYPGAHSSITLVFENVGRSRTFQIFITPYGYPSVSESRFKLDVGGNVVRDQATTTFNGVSAMTFINESALGSLRELWIVHNGFLYEITAPDSLASWFENVLTSWQFL